MEKGPLLLFAICFVLWGCSEPPIESTTERLNAAAAQALIGSLTDSITVLQAQLQVAQSHQKRNDSLSALVKKLISDQQRNISKSEKPLSPPAASSPEIVYNARLATLTKERDSIDAAYQQSNSDLKKMAQELAKKRTEEGATSRKSDSLRVVNSNLLTALNKSRQQLDAVAQQKKKDSLLLASSTTSTASQQRELSRLITQRDSLQKANRLISVNAQNYQKDINRLKQQRKSDSLRYVSSPKAAAPGNESSNTNRERDSLLTVSERLAKQLASREGRIDRLTERIGEDSVKLLAYQAKPAENNASSDPAANIEPVPAPAASDQQPDDVESGVSMEPAENGENSNATDSTGTIRRWADPSFSEAKARDLREGFRLLLLAQQEEKRNPTLSLKLLREAGRYSNDSIISAETRRVYDNNYFYEVLVQKKRGVRAISLNDKFLAANLSNDSAYLYSGIDSVIFMAKGLSKVSAVLLPPQPYLFAGSPSGQVVVHNLTSGKQQASFQAHSERITSFGFVGRNEVFLATGSADKTIYLWSNKYEKGDRLVGLKTPVIHISVSRGNLISGASGDFAPRLWNIEGKLLLNLTGHKDSVYSLDISDNARFLLTTSADKTASLWDLKGTFVRSFGGHRAALTHGKISHGHRLVALASVDGTIALWGINGNLMGKLTGHTQQVNQVAFDKTDTYLYTCSDDGTVRRWLIKKPKEIDLSTIPPFTPKERTEYKIK